MKKLLLSACAAAIISTPIVAQETSPIPTVGIIFKPFSYEQVECLSLNIYYEARGSNLADKAAVADVVLNRVKDSRYPNSVCEVVKQGYRKGRKDCQFSWYCDGKPDTPYDKDRWYEAQSIAWNMMDLNEYRGITEGATHYHATYVTPSWTRGLKLVGRIGGHVYYRWD